MNFWDAKTYCQFIHYRTRPAQDLLSAIPVFFQPTTVYDLGCGPGNSTALLQKRWPKAKITGLDSSTDMLQAAQKDYPHLHFIQGDIVNFTPVEKKADCLFANASLQWLDNHELLIPQLLQHLNVNGVLAIQMPNNFHSPLHQTTIELLEKNSRWQPLLKKLRYGKLMSPFYKLADYYDLFIKAGMNNLQLWETEYFQEMQNYDEIFNWIKGTALAPIYSGMSLEDQNLFTEQYISAIKKSYPPQQNNKILLPFRRIFIIGCHYN